MAYLKNIKDPIIKRLFITNCGNGSKSATIKIAFIWSETPEGAEFWHRVYLNPNVSFESIKNTLPKGYKHEYDDEYTAVKSLYKIAKDGMKYKAVTKSGKEFHGVIKVIKNSIYLCNNQQFGYHYSYSPGYKNYACINKGGKDAIDGWSIKSISIKQSTSTNTPKTPAKTPETSVKTYDNLQVNFCENYVIINGVKITDEQLQGIALAQGVCRIS